MPAFDDLTGQRFGFLSVLDRAPGRVRWRCRCDCGRDKIAYSFNLKDGTTRSCGCGLGGRKWASRDGQSTTRLYSIWRGLFDRCDNQAHSGFDRYGGRGIRVCSEWRSFRAFARWAEANGYAPNLTIDRIDNNGNYEPTNCRWATRKEQQSNTKLNRYVEISGERMTPSEAARRHGVVRETLRLRLIRGVPIEEALKPPQ